MVQTCECSKVSSTSKDKIKPVVGMWADGGPGKKVKLHMFYDLKISFLTYLQKSDNVLTHLLAVSCGKDSEQPNTKNLIEELSVPVNQSWDSQCAFSTLLSSKETTTQPAHPAHPVQSGTGTEQNRKQFRTNTIPLTVPNTHCESEITQKLVGSS